MTEYPAAASRGATSRHIRCVCGKPCNSTTGRPLPHTATFSETAGATSTRRYEKLMPRPCARRISNGSAANNRAVTSFRVLGPLEAGDPDSVPLKGPRHRTVLARLLIAHGRVVPVDVLADDVWSGAPPSGAVAAIRTF